MKILNTSLLNDITSLWLGLRNINSITNLFIGPALVASLGPVVEVLLVPADVEHVVEATGASQHLATRPLTTLSREKTLMSLLFNQHKTPIAHI